jgi:UDP-4-amino-4,6-dideoxy-N-acetyl-beta-L-altrosamine transaminase
MNIPYGRQSISWQDYMAVLKVLRSDYLTVGPMVDKFEQELSALTMAKYVVVVSSGTAALHCAYNALSMNERNEIITSPMTFVATASTALHCGAKIVFGDIDLETGNLDSNIVESLISDKTIAISTVDYAGQPGDLDSLNRIAKVNNLTLIEDAAHSIGTTYNGLEVGGLADMTIFSFFPTKNITSGEGGAILTNNFELYSRLKSFKMHGLVRQPELFYYKDVGPWHQEVHQLGLNYRLSEIHAALGLSQLKRIKKFKTKREEIFNAYHNFLKDVEDVILPTKVNHINPMWHLFPIRVPQNKRKSLFNLLRSEGFIVQVNYLPVYLHPYFLELGYKKGSCPNAELFYETEISLPMHVNLNMRQIERISNIIIKFFKS